MRGGRMLRLVGAGVGLVAMAVGCGHSTTVGEARTDHVSHTAATASRPPEITMPNGSFSLAQVPAGFRAWRHPRHEDGPIPGTSYDAQDFLNNSAKQKFTVSVHRGVPVAFWTDPNRAPNPVPSPRKIQGRETYSINMGISLQREFAWVINPSTLAYVIGSNMTDDQLLSVAEGVQVSQ